MSNFQLFLANLAIEEMERLPDVSQGAVEEAMDRLVTSPIKVGTRLKGVGSKNRPLYAMEVGAHRVIYSVDRNSHRVTVVKIASRGAFRV